MRSVYFKLFAIVICAVAVVGADTVVNTDTIVNTDMIVNTEIDTVINNGAIVRPGIDDDDAIVIRAGAAVGADTIVNTDTIVDTDMIVNTKTIVNPDMIVNTNTIDTIVNSEIDPAINNEAIVQAAPDSSGIHQLFANAGELVDTGVARVLPPFEGDYRILIVPPIYAAYDDEPGTAWVSAIGEIFAYYHVASLPRVRVFSMEQVAGVMPNFRDRGRRFDRPHYAAAGRKLGATHVVFQEYLPLSGGGSSGDDSSGDDSSGDDSGDNGSDVYYGMSLYRVEEGVAEVAVFDTVSLADLERGLGGLFGAIAAAVGRPAEVASSDSAAVDSAGVVAAVDSARVVAGIDSTAVDTSSSIRLLFGGDSAVLRAVGSALLAEDAFTPERAAAAYAAVERLVRDDPDIGKIGGVRYAAALLAGRARNYERAVNHITTLINGYGGDPPPWLWLYFAECLRGIGRYGDAIRVAANAASVPVLKTPAAIEAAMSHQAQGSADSARVIYESIVIDGEADGFVFFQLALLNAQAGNIIASEEIVEVAGRREVKFRSEEYFELGVAYGKVPGGAERAAEYIKRSMGENLNDERAWLAMADIHARAQNRELWAEAGVNLFRIDQSIYGDMAKAAGRIYEELGYQDRAKEIYNFFLARRYVDGDVSIALARIYMAERDCERLREVLRLQDFIPVSEAARMLESCGIRVVDPRRTMSPPPRLSRNLKIARVSAGIVAVGGIAGGLLLNRAVESEGLRYANFAPEGSPARYTDAENRSKVLETRQNIEAYTTGRNLLYALGILGAGGFAVTFFF